MNKQEAQAVEQLRRENSDLLSAKYGTDYNVLRWAQGYGFDLEEASAQLRRHLKFRKFYDLDNADQIPEHQILKKYFPIGLVGPYRILWASVYTNYPEWISQMFIVNAPSFMSLIWKAVSPLIPERTRNKVKICTANSDWKSLIQKYAKAENIPAHWGGTLVDANGDGMCRDRLNIPFEPIPHELYWTPDERAPGLNDINCAVIPAGKAKTITYVVNSHEPTYIVVNRFCDRTFGMGIWYHENMAAVDYSLDEMNDWFPDFDYPGMPTVDYLRIRTLGPGVYKVKFGNEQAWIRSLTVYYRILFENEAGEKVDFKELP
ncbi:CRAL/TRIO domain protein [Ancylostoma caninum]|uniref:CRAL/TRIO domain protein n=1 Tax=Ancylostoma caninum TaxID=29170 RepID=A0A368FTH9_ANCCA|nr:CRAL/TRIO domain protein [Ancylostoma caninum]